MAKIMRNYNIWFQYFSFLLLERTVKKTEESESHVETEIKRKVQQKRHCSAYQASPLSPASKKCVTQLEVSREITFSC